MSNAISPIYRVLLVEDHSETREILKELLERNGYEVCSVATGEAALPRLTASDGYDLILLDLMLPGMNGFRIMRAMRITGRYVPTLVLSGRGDQDQVLTAFKLGATDYVRKPFNSEELLARVKTILQRTKAAAEAPMEIVHLDDFEINLSAHVARRGDEEVSLTHFEYELFEYLLKKRGQLCTRQEILRDVWRLSGDIQTRTVDRHISSLRRKIEKDPDYPVYIETVYGQGYRFQLS